MPSLFEPFTLKSVTLRNRIVAAPMCMYSVQDGIIGGWHRAHLEQLAVGGAGMVTVEMTDVSPEGRITWAEPYRQIELLTYDVDQPVTELRLDADVRMFAEEPSDQRRHSHTAKAGG